MDKNKKITNTLKPVNIERWISPESQMCRIGKKKWKVTCLIRASKDLEVMDIPLQHLDITDSFDDLNLRQFVSHMQAVHSAKLKYPIILNEDGRIMDGRHRIMRALLFGHTTIKAVRFDKDPENCEHS